MITALLILASLLVIVGMIGIARLALISGPFGFAYFYTTFNCMWELFIVILSAIVKQNE